MSLVAHLMILDIKSHIVADEGYLGGRPRIANTRFGVRDVVHYHFYQGMALETISSQWDIPIAALYAALAYYFDHKAEIDRSIKEDDAYVASIQATPKHRQESISKSLPIISCRKYASILMKVCRTMSPLD